VIATSFELPIIVIVKTNALSVLSSQLDEASGRSLADILRREGVDLSAPDFLSLPPGTPVYVRSGADLSNVQLSMTKANCRMIPVLDGQSLIGFIKTVDPDEGN
jgi:hypothetical protein